MTTTDHLRQLLAKATPGPWRVFEYSENSTYIFSDADEDTKSCIEANAADAAAIVVLLNAAPALLDVVDAARKMSTLLDQTVGVPAGNQSIKVSSKSEEVMVMFCAAQNDAREALAKLDEETKP